MRKEGLYDRQKAFERSAGTEPWPESADGPGPGRSGPAHPDPGDRVTIKPEPKKDYVVDKVIVKDKEGKPVPVEKQPGGSFTYTHPKGKVSIEVSFRPAKPGPEHSGVDALLNTSGELAYLHGFADGSFGPERNITRAQVAQMFYNLLLEKEVPGGRQFTDVGEDAWCHEAIQTLSALGIMRGISESEFAPNRPITRAEFAVTAMRFAKVSEGEAPAFTDVLETDWFYDSLCGAVGYGWIQGYPDGSFRPRQPITRAQTAVMVNRMLGRKPGEELMEESPDRQFSDVTPRHWAYRDICEASRGTNK